jgi:hypothetical protein
MIWHTVNTERINYQQEVGVTISCVLQKASYTKEEKKYYRLSADRFKTAADKPLRVAKVLLDNKKYDYIQGFVYQRKLIFVLRFILLMFWMGSPTLFNLF